MSVEQLIPSRWWLYLRQRVLRNYETDPHGALMLHCTHPTIQLFAPPDEEEIRSLVCTANCSRCSHLLAH